MHDSFLPISGAILLANMMVDEVIIGALGSGLYGMLLFCVVSVFVDGLVVGRTPEYCRQKIEALEIKMTIMALACVPAASARQQQVRQDSLPVPTGPAPQPDPLRPRSRNTAHK